MLVSVKRIEIKWGTNLHLNVQDANATFFCYVLDGFDAGAVVIASELGVLDEALFVY